MRRVYSDNFILALTYGVPAGIISVVVLYCLFAFFRRIVMKKLFLMLGLLLGLSAFANAAFVDSGQLNSGEETVTDGSYGQCWLKNDAILNLQGGSIQSLGMEDTSTLNMSDGDITAGVTVWHSSLVNVYGGNINSISAENFSKINIYGGAIEMVVMGYSSATTISGGQIDCITTGSIIESGVRATLICDIDSVEVSGNILSGRWLDNSTFDIELKDFYGNSPINHIQFVPEPAGIGLVCVGFLYLRKRRAI